MRYAAYWAGALLAVTLPLSGQPLRVYSELAKIDALGEVTLKVDFGDGELVTGKGASTDIIEASARAYLNAVNRFVTNGKGRAKKPPQP